MSVVFVCGDKKYIFHSELWFKKKKKERHSVEGLSSFLYGPWKSSSLCPWEKINLQTRGRRSRRRSLPAGRKITAHDDGRCSGQQVIQGQCPQRDPTTCSRLFVVSTLLLSHVSRLLWGTALLVLNSSAFWMLQHETKCVHLFLTFLLQEIVQHMPTLPDSFMKPTYCHSASTTIRL